MSEDVYKINIKLMIHGIIREKMKEQKSKIRLHFNHSNMKCSVNIFL